MGWIYSIYIFKIGKSDRYINIRAVGRSASAMAGVALQTGPIAGKQKEAGTTAAAGRGMSYVRVYIDSFTRRRVSLWTPLERKRLGSHRDQRSQQWLLRSHHMSVSVEHQRTRT